MLLALAIGDAYGAGFEFAPREKIDQHNKLTGYQQHGLGIKAGCYTDDTQMSLAISELLISKAPWTKTNIANHFVACYKRDRRLGYSSGFQALLDSVNDGQELLEQINPNSSRNGAAMRAAPLGVLADIETLLHYAKLQAQVTHDTPEAIESAQAIALAAHYMLYQRGDKAGLSAFVSQHGGGFWDDNWHGEVPCSAWETVNAVLTLLKNADSLSALLLMGVDFGGDVDTVTALALAIASESGQYQADLPAFLAKNLEAGPFGHDYLAALSRQLMALKA
ncbi:ADP-ribosylglycohydrolase family protein [Gallaecimonas mangrovi]|uniref:ADP-ribosylglycohydrolase family protein n=1 Tax=Gallaecimonas mangrovi TaxID=2291597 RepID=UPI000E20B272|nr:ADP-ribosylglycohydrolase family protein [Gallaecimonas mangrovi]